MAIVDPVVIDGVVLERTWITPTRTARVHLLPAHEADRCVIIRRKPSKLFHVMCWDTRRDTIEHGSWFRGKLYRMRCDVSWDGRWMVYLAMGNKGQTWNGLCKLPWLKAVVEASNAGSAWAGGGVFTARDTLEANTLWHTEQSLADANGPRTKALTGYWIRRRDSGGEDEPVLYRRLERDGWQRRGAFWGTERELEDKLSGYAVATVGDDGWQWQPTSRHPALNMWYRGYLARGRTFEFELEGYAGLLDARVEWATWSCKGDLLVARQGHVQRYGLADLRRGKPAFEVDLNALSPPHDSGGDAP